MKTLVRYLNSIKQLLLSVISCTLLIIFSFISFTTTVFADVSLQLPPTTLLPPIGHVSNTFIDLTGRTVILHGANIMNKKPPFYFPSFYQSDGNGSTIGENWAKFYAANGFNVARVGILWSGVEPSPGIYNDAYIIHIRDMVRMFAKYGVYCILDFHQDSWTGAPIAGLTPNTFGGDGFPAWTANYALNGVAQANNSDSAPINLYSSPALQAIWDNFWHNVPSPPDTIGVQDRYIKMYAHVANLFKLEPNLLYYGAINEPNPDIYTWQSLGQPGFINWLTNSSLYPPNILSEANNSTFFRTLMPSFYNKLNAAIHHVDPLHMVGNDRTFYEILGDHIPVVPKPIDSNIVLGRTFYGSQNSAQAKIDFLQSPAIAKANKMGFFAQEWGSLLEGDQTYSAYYPVVRYMDQNQISWSYWDFAEFPLNAPMQDQTFDNANSVSGWSPLISSSTISWTSTIGKPGGSMSVSFVSDPPNQPNGVQIELPFNAGDLSAPGRMISMDVMVTTDSPDVCIPQGFPPCFSTYLMLVTNNGPNYDFIPQLQNGVPADGNWYSLQSGPLPMQPVNDVKQLTLAFFGTPAGLEHVYVDNIKITGAPFQLPVTKDLVYDTSVTPSGNIVNNSILNTMVEPYPRVIAGTPISYQYDPASNVFTMSYSKKGANGSEILFLLPTEIFVPQLNYPNGYNAEVNGGTVISAPNANLLLILRKPSFSTVSVTITPK